VIKARVTDNKLKEILMSDFLQRLKREVLIENGGILTDLGNPASDLDGSFQRWVIDHPDIYQAAVKAHFNVGGDVASTFTGGLNRLTLKKTGLEDTTREMNYTMAKLVKEVTPNNCYVAFGLHSHDFFLPPVGDATVDEVYESYVEQITIAEEIGVDLFRIISIDLGQMALAIKAIKDNSKLPILGSFYFNPTPTGFGTIVGIDSTTCAKKLEELGVDIVGVTCRGLSYKQTTTVLRDMGTACSKLLAASPDAGIPQQISGKIVYSATPEELAKEVPNWVAAGARLIGGCCGTTPKHVAKLVSVLK
jgi:5-methyltetrahydrofolate--homocysteine methyltransferase